MPLVEIISGEDTSRETITTAFNFAQAIRKQPITCKEVPGFVVNRILNSGVGEVWREQEEKGLSIKQIDEAIAGANVTPMGPFFLIDMLGLDTVLHVAEYLNESYGDRFYVHTGMQKLVADGKLGAKSGGDGFYSNGEPNIEGDAEPERRGARRPADAEDLQGGLQRPRGGHLHRSRDRSRDDGRRRPRSQARALPALLEGGPRGPRHDSRAKWRNTRGPMASASRRRGS